MSGPTWRFIRHFFEMLAAMAIGMVVLGLASELLLDLPDRTAVTLLEMGVWMTVPMIAWMRIRGHAWRTCNEMAAAMLLPSAGALALLGSGLVTDAGTLLAIEHLVMVPSMLAAMLLRRDEYTGHHHRRRARTDGSVAISRRQS